MLPYYRMLSAEPVLALEPTLILGTKEVGPPEVVQQFKDAGVTTLLLPQQLTTDGTMALITAVGQALGRDAEAATLIDSVKADLDAAATVVAGATSQPTVMMLLLPPGAPLLVSGTGTEADTMIGLAGALNAVTGFPGYIPLTPEAAVAAAPDIILTTTSSLEAAGGIDGLLAMPGISDTPAGQAKAIVAIDDLELLSFGPRTGQAIAALATQLHPELAK
jgi:iron complex transport system substrate-binding protein